MSKLHEAQGTVHVQLKLSKLHYIQLKPSKQRNQSCEENKKQTNKQKPKTQQWTEMEVKQK